MPISAPRATYTLRAVLAGYFAASRTDTASSILLDRDECRRDTRLVLTRTGAIGGTVSDERGEPAVGAYVCVFQSSLDAGLRQFAVGPTTRTDDRGHYRVAGLAAGRYAVEVEWVQVTRATVMSAVVPESALTAWLAVPHMAIGDAATERAAITASLAEYASRAITDGAPGLPGVINARRAAGSLDDFVDVPADRSSPSRCLPGCWDD